MLALAGFAAAIAGLVGVLDGTPSDEVEVSCGHRDPRRDCPRLRGVPAARDGRRPAPELVFSDRHDLRRLSRGRTRIGGERSRSTVRVGVSVGVCPESFPTGTFPGIPPRSRPRDRSPCGCSWPRDPPHPNRRTPFLQGSVQPSPCAAVRPTRTRMSVQTSRALTLLSDSSEAHMAIWRLRAALPVRRHHHRPGRAHRDLRRRESARRGRAGALAHSGRPRIPVLVRRRRHWLSCPERCERREVVVRAASELCGSAKTPRQEGARMAHANARLGPAGRRGLVG